MAHRPVYLSASTGTNSTYASPAGEAKLDKIIVGTSAASSVITVYDAPTSLGNTVSVISGATEKYLNFNDLYFPNGFSVYQTGAAAKVTLVVG